MTELWRKILRWTKIIVGFALLLFGVIGGFIPILQGWVFVLAGLAILSTEFRWAKKLNRWMKVKFKTTIAKVKAKRAEKKADEPGQT